MKVLLTLFIGLVAPSIFAYDVVCSNMQGASVTYDSESDVDADGFSGDKFYLTFSSNSLVVEMSGLNNMKDTAKLSFKSNDGWTSYIAAYGDVQRIWTYYPSKKVLARADIQTLIFYGTPEIKVMMSKCR